jgi:hypothetical protein
MRWATTARENFVVQHGGLGALLHCLGTTESNEARKQCAVTIASLAAQMPQYKVAVLAAVGDAADGEKLLSADTFGSMSGPEAFAEDLDIDPVACEKIAAAVPTQASLGTAGGVASSDQWSSLPPMPKSVLMDDIVDDEEDGVSLPFAPSLSLSLPLSPAHAQSSDHHVLRVLSTPTRSFSDRSLVITGRV